MFCIPKSFPSKNAIAAKPNIMFEKNAPRRRIFVICQITNCGELNLKSLKFDMFFAIGSILPLLRNEIAVLTPYQKIEERATIFTRTSAIAQRRMADTTE